MLAKVHQDASPHSPRGLRAVAGIAHSRAPGSYREVAQGDLDAAFALYEWNIDVAAAALSLTAMVEVLLRNALDREMRAWAAKRGVHDWLAAAPLDDRGVQDIRKARARADRADTASRTGPSSPN